MLSGLPQLAQDLPQGMIVRDGGVRRLALFRSGEKSIEL